MEPRVISSGILPDYYIRPQSERPNLSEGHRMMTKLIGDACGAYGFSQVINHGVSKETIQKMIAMGHEFFNLLVEEKMKFLYSDDPSKTMRLPTSFNVKKETVQNWRDCHSYPFEKYVPEWPTIPSSFKDINASYCMEVQQHGFRLQEVIAERLRLNKGSFKNVLEEQGKHMAVNYYPPCPEPDLTYGLPAHTDPNALTILLQDLPVAGLQVLKDGNLLAMKPHPDDFVINIGDQLQVKEIQHLSSMSRIRLEGLSPPAREEPQVMKAIKGLMAVDTSNSSDPSLTELEEMEKQKTAIDKKAELMVRRELWGGLGFLIIKIAAIIRLTFWELSWDIMEPICFCITSMYFMAAYVFFLRTSREPSFEGFFQIRFIAKQKGLMERHNFDINRYYELKK